MKATLEFNLPEDRDEFQKAFQGAEWAGLISDFDQWLRGEIKHNDRAEFEPVRKALYEFIDSANLELNA